MADTPNHEYNVPQQGTQDWHNPLNENFEAFEVDIELRDTESNLGNYTPTDGAKFLATDTGVVYVGDGTTWVPQFVLVKYDAAAGTATVAQTLVTAKLDVGTITGQLTGGTPLSTIAGDNLSIDSNGQLNASTGGGGISGLSGGDGIDPSSIGDGETLSVAWGDANNLDSSGAVDTISGTVTGGTTLTDLTGTNLSIDSNGRLNATTSGGGISGLNGGDGINPNSIGDGDTLSVAWGDASNLDSSGAITDWSGAADLDSSGAVDTLSGSVTGGTTLTDLTGTNLSIDSNGRLNATTSGGGISGLSGGDGINPNSIGDGDTVSVAWADANGLDSNGEITGDNWNVNSNDILEPSDSSVNGINVTQAKTPTVRAENNPFHVLVGGSPAMELEAESGDDAGNVVMGHSTNNAGSVVGATISGGGADGSENTVGGNYSTVGGGLDNTASADHTTVAGGNGNTASADNATVAGGRSNTASDAHATVAGGLENTANDIAATVGGGANNTAEASFATIAGGGPTDTNNPDSTNNVVYDNYGTIGGGGNNQAGSDDGDPQDPMSAEYATVAGGHLNKASGEGATVAGGETNTASGDYATVGGGAALNKASGDYATVGGGGNNNASGEEATVAGGVRNTASGGGATVPGGERGAAEGDNSFVLNDDTPYHDIPNTGSDGLSSNTAVDGEPVTGANTFSVSATAGVRFITGSESSPNVTYIPGDSAGWTTTSSRAVKTNIDPVEPREALDGVESMEIATWEYENENGDGEGTTHIGPMAEAFHDAFDVGSSDKHINSINADGVAFAAIQGLAERLDEKDERIDDLEAENEELKERLAAVEERLDTIDSGSASPVSADD